MHLVEGVFRGNVNGLAIVIFLSQLVMFKEQVDGQTQWLQGTDMITMLGLVILTMLIMWLLPKLTKAIPSALVAIIVVAGITILGNLDVSTVGSFIRDGGGNGLQGGLPIFQSDLLNVVPSIAGHWSITKNHQSRQR